MAYTRHGHHIAGTPYNEPVPDTRARCGGAQSGYCRPCKEDADLALRWMRTIGEPTNFVEKSRAIATDYINASLMAKQRHKEDPFPQYDLYTVWFVKTLQNWKSLLSTTLPDGNSYEILYDGNNRQTLVSTYTKVRNLEIPGRREFTHEVHAKNILIKDLSHGPLETINPKNWEVRILWSAELLQNWKGVLVSSSSEGTYYEVTYNGNKEVTYLDEYHKTESVIIPD